jgi:hypothetical protein
MRRTQLVLIGLIGALVLTASLGCDGSEKGLASASAVQSAMQSGRDWLWARQKPDGSWPESGSQFAGGSTALAAWALMESGVEADNPDLARALNYLAGLETDMTYTLAIRANVWASAMQKDPGKYRPLLAKDIRALLGGSRDGAYSYESDAEGPALGDQSNSHYAVMGMQTALDNQIDVPRQYWQQVMRYWLGVQNADGGWPYSRPGTPSTPTMTTAAICTLELCMHQTERNDAAERAIQRGRDWLAGQMPESLGRKRLMYYYFLALQRMQRLTGQDRLAGVDLSRQIRVELLTRQMPDGGWDGAWGREIASAYAVLVLSRGM